MKNKHFLSVLFTIPFSILLASNPVKAFNLRNDFSPLMPGTTQDFYDTTNGQKGKIYMDFVIKKRPPHRHSEFWRVLTSSFPSSEWDFRSSGTPVYGDFVVRAHRVCVPFSECSQGQSVGGQLELEYVPNFSFSPETRQPDPNTGRVRWIQLVRSNHSLAGGHGVRESIIDLDIYNPNNGTPFYDADPDSDNQSDTYFFSDAPARLDIDEEHDWWGDLYLAEEIPQADGQPRKVLIYGGVSWGWHNRILKKDPGLIPKPQEEENQNENQNEWPIPSCVSVCYSYNPPSNGGSGGGGFNKYDPYERYATIPESTPAIGLITLTAWAIVKTLKLRKNK